MKANSTLAVLQRNVKVPWKEVKAATYKVLVRPHLEYASSVWDPPPAPTVRLRGYQTSFIWSSTALLAGSNTIGPTDMISQLG